MTIYLIASTGGDGTQTNTTHASLGALDWSKADTSLANLLAYDAAALSSGNLILVAHDHAQSQASALSIDGPTQAPPVYMISCTRGQATATYQPATGNQFQTTGANDLTLNGSFAIYGCTFNSGQHIVVVPDNNESMFCQDVRLMPGANGQIKHTAVQTRQTFKDCIVDLTNDGSSNRAATVFDGSGVNAVTYTGLTFVNAQWRTNAIFSATTASHLYVSGADFSGFTNATPCEVLIAAFGGVAVFQNCLMASGWAPFNVGSPLLVTEATFINCGPADDPTALIHYTYYGLLTSTTAVTRDGGAEVEGEGVSWQITTTANCTEGSPFTTPWQYGLMPSAGAKVLTAHIVNDTADLTNAEVWPEVEYLSTADEAIYAMADGQRATIVTTAANQPDDTTSAWSGSPDFTYKQSLPVSFTVGEPGTFRWRLCFGKTSLASGDNCYVDPKMAVAAA